MSVSADTTRTPMPDVVFIAICLLGVQSLLSVYAVELRIDWDLSRENQIEPALYLVISGFYIYGLVRQQNWLRWITILYVTYQVVILPFTLPKFIDDAQFVLRAFEIFAGLFAVVLLCLQNARRWYQ